MVVDCVMYFLKYFELVLFVVVVVVVVFGSDHKMSSPSHCDDVLVDSDD